jgi:hypothetical protein
VVTGVVADLLNALPTAAQARRNRRVRRG